MELECGAPPGVRQADVNWFCTGPDASHQYRPAMSETLRLLGEVGVPLVGLPSIGPPCFASMFSGGPRGGGRVLKRMCMRVDKTYFELVRRAVAAGLQDLALCEGLCVTVVSPSYRALLRWQKTSTRTAPSSASS